MMKTRFWRAAAVAVAVLQLNACSSGEDNPLLYSCIPGQLAICPCEGGGTGTQECSADGVFATCACDSGADGFVDTLDVNTTSDAGVDVPPDTDRSDADAREPGADTETVDVDASRSDTAGISNLCGGSEPLFYGGVGAAPGDDCECGGRLGCTDGGNRLTCVGSQPPNACGGCSALPGALGEPCGECAVGAWVCAGLELVCDGGIDENACGGCTPLANEPGTLCDGPDGAGLWACDGDDALLCLGEGRNACGGLGLLPSQPGTPCGQCLGGTTICAGREATVCRDADLRVNVCGGCGTLDAEPGDSCGCEGVRACDPDNPDVLLCENPGLNACGGCVELQGAPGEACAAGRLYCASPDQLLCGTSDVNACGGSESLVQVPGSSCGACDSGVWACASLNSLFCDGDRGVSATNACGGCSELPATPASRCGTCNSGTLVCDGLESVVCVGDRGPAAERLFYADVDRDLWGDPAASVRACTAPEGYVERAGDCNDRAVLVNPDALEIPGNGVDENCDLEELCYRDMDGDGFRAIGSLLTVPSPDLQCRNFGAAPATAPTTDCDDSNPGAFPGNTETVGNGIDEDCDRRELCFVDADGDGYRADDAATILTSDLSCGGNRQVDDLAPTGDCDDSMASTYPGATELCDGRDNNCNTIVDDPAVALAACSLNNAFEACADGTCAIATCNPGWGDCNESPSDGCEQFLLDDFQNCGTCGRRCAATDVCSDGACIPQRQPVAILSEWPMCIRRFDQTVSCMGYGIEFVDPYLIGPEPTLVDIPWLTSAIAIHTNVYELCAIFADQRAECRPNPFFRDGTSYIPTRDGARDMDLSVENKWCIVDREGLVKCANSYTSPPEYVELPAPAVKVAVSLRYSCALLETDSLWCWGIVPTPGVVGPQPSTPPSEVASGGNIRSLAVTNNHILWLTEDGALNRRGYDTDWSCSSRLYDSGVTDLLPHGPHYRLQDGRWFRAPQCTSSSLYPGVQVRGARTSGILLEYISPSLTAYYNAPPDNRKVCQIYTDLTSACGPLEWSITDPDVADRVGQFNGIVSDGSEYPFCDDALDNDGDGLTNCQDPDCGAAAACAPITDIQVGAKLALATRSSGITHVWGDWDSPPRPFIRPTQWPDGLGREAGTMVNMELIDAELSELDEIDIEVPDTHCFSIVPTFERQCRTLTGWLVELLAPDTRSIIDVVRKSSLWVLTYENQLFTRPIYTGLVVAYDAPNLDQIISAPRLHGPEATTLFGRTRGGEVVKWAFQGDTEPPAELTFEPVQPDNAPESPVAEIDGDSALACLRYESGEVYCTGSTGTFNQWAADATQIEAVGGTLCTLDATNALRCTGLVGFTGTLEDVTAFDLGANSGCAVVDQQQIWCWGSNLNGQLGTGSSGGFSPRPVRVFGQ